VGAEVAVFTGRVLTEQFKFKLDNRCSNNQAEQLAIIKALKVIETKQVTITNKGQQSSTWTEDDSGLDKE